MLFVLCCQVDGSWRCKHGEDECSGDVQQLCVRMGLVGWGRSIGYWLYLAAQSPPPVCLLCSQDDGSWRCKHGEEECSGDLQQLCVQKFSKPYNRVKWTLGFVLCSNKQGLDATGSFATASRCLQVRQLEIGVVGDQSVQVRILEVQGLVIPFTIEQGRTICEWCTNLWKRLAGCACPACHMHMCVFMKHSLLLTSAGDPYPSVCRYKDARLHLWPHTPGRPRR